MANAAVDCALEHECRWSQVKSLNLRGDLESAESKIDNQVTTVFSS